MGGKASQDSMVRWARGGAWWLVCALCAWPAALWAEAEPAAAAATAAPAAAADAKPCDKKDCDKHPCCEQDCDDADCDDDDDCCAGEPCPERHGPCAEKHGDCPGKAGPCPEKQGDCPHKAGPCPEGHGDCPEKAAKQPCDKPCDPPCEGEGPGKPGHGWKHPGPPPGPFGFRGLHLRPEALIQVQGVAYTGKDAQLSNGDRAHEPGFALRRARFGFEGGLGRRLDFGIVTDLAASQPLSEAWFGIGAWHNAKLIVGAQKVPFSHFAMMGSGEQALAERPFSVNAMAPYRQVGATLTGKYHLLGAQWFIGAYNGFERNKTFFAGIQENAGFNGDHFNGLSYVGRLQFEPLGQLGPAVADHSHKSLRFEVGGGAVYNDGGTTKSFSYSADAHIKWRGAHIAFEWLRDEAKPQQTPTSASTIPADINRQAIIAEAGYAFWRFNAAARFELIDPNTAVSNNEDQKIISGALGYQLVRNRMRVQLQYDHRAESKGTPGQAGLENDTVFGQFQLML